MSQKQAKKRRREERTRAEQKAPVQNNTTHEEVRDLEELLSEGNIDDYAQTCWTLANRMEGPPVVGNMITLGGPCEEHGSHEYPFRLTLGSMMTITQCAGMETCGEAIRLVASKLPPESTALLRTRTQRTISRLLHVARHRIPMSAFTVAKLPNFNGGSPRASAGQAKYRSRE